MNNNNLTEGLRSNDLRDLILPIVSIDEYESKIGDNNDVIVIGFFLEDKDPADDLSAFIDRSIHDLLDTDVSAAPTPTGYYMVFVEIERNPKFIETLNGILEDIENLVSVDKWYFKAYKVDDVKELNDENLEEFVRLKEKTYEHFRINRFLKNTLADQVYFDDDYVVLEHRGKKYTFDVVELTNDAAPVTLTFEDLARTKELDKVFGGDYAVNILEGYITVTNHNNGYHLKLKRV